MNIITFLSDFGHRDGYTGSVKGIILSINPRVQIVDISHSVSAYRIEQGAYILASYYNEYPGKTVHLAVVDPGVGSQRIPLIIKTSRYFFVGPDNGLFTFILQREACQVYRISLPRLLKLKVGTGISSTFHARDVFGPAAALLSRGVPVASLADSADRNPQMLGDLIRRVGNSIRARVIVIDHFGNIITALSRHQLASKGDKTIKAIKIKKTIISSLHQTYSDVQPGSLLALWGSNGFLEIAVNQGNAADMLDCVEGADQVDIDLQ